MPRKRTAWSVISAFEEITETSGIVYRCRVLKDDGNECRQPLRKQVRGSTSHLTQHIRNIHANHDKERTEEVIQETISRLQERSRKRQRTLTAEDFPTEEFNAEEAAIDWIVHDGLPLYTFESCFAARAMRLEEPISARTIGRRMDERLEDAMTSISKELRHEHSFVLANLRTLMILRHAAHGRLTMDHEIVDDEECVDDSNGLPGEEDLAAADATSPSAAE